MTWLVGHRSTGWYLLVLGAEIIPVDRLESVRTVHGSIERVPFSVCYDQKVNWFVLTVLHYYGIYRSHNCNFRGTHNQWTEWEWSANEYYRWGRQFQFTAEQNEPIHFYKLNASRKEKVNTLSKRSKSHSSSTFISVGRFRVCLGTVPRTHTPNEERCVWRCCFDAALSCG